MSEFDQQMLTTINEAMETRLESITKNCVRESSPVQEKGAVIKSKSKRQPKRQPTPEQVAETVRTNAQELYKHYRDMLYRSDSKDISAHAEAVATNEALGVLAYSIPPCDVEAFDSPMVCAYRAMHVLTLLDRAAASYYK